jgi:PPOX class probable F420-dependent enzyme
LFTDEQRSLLEGKNFAHLATLMPDGSPHVSPVWVGLDGDDVIVNTAEGRIKTRNVRRDPRVALSVVDQQDPYSNVTVRGVVVEMTHEGADEGIDRFAEKYLGLDRYPWRNPDERRVVLRIRPQHIGA